MLSEKILVDLLATRAYLVQVLGDRTYPNAAPEGEQRTHLTYGLITSPRVRSLQGYSNLAHPEYQLIVSSTSYGVPKAIADEIRRLNGFRGILQGNLVQWVWVTDESDNYDPPRKGDEKVTHQAEVTIEIWHQE